MSNAWEDSISPKYVRASRIKLTLDSESPEPAAMRSIVVNVDYSQTSPQGVQLPLILEVIGPSHQSHSRKVFSKHAPDSVVVTPIEGGPHKVIIREFAHNRWWGALSLSVAGERLQAPRPA